MLFRKRDDGSASVSQKVPADVTQGSGHSDTSSQTTASPELDSNTHEKAKSGEAISLAPLTAGTDGEQAAQTQPHGIQATPPPSTEEVKFAITFARLVSVLMRSPHYKHYTLADLEWLVAPPALLGQCVIMDANANGRSTPVAAAFWALVSEDVDKKIRESTTVPIKLRPDEWRSGDIIWLVDVIGDQHALPTFLRHLQENVFKGRRVYTKITK
ncbi:MAG: toxin-activating lysine-acyltransferase [Hyphomicrobiales bacterium]|nr:toxin-activating lysine-acyltransferase [Hyphomicrobiales bacterium]